MTVIPADIILLACQKNAPKMIDLSFFLFLKPYNAAPEVLIWGGGKPLTLFYKMLIQI
jgi:hypothetical protein